MGTVQGASKIKLKNVNKKRMATARTLKAVATATAAIVVLTPANFLPFPKTKIELSASFLHF
jgi:hypothetical protein